MNERRKFTPEFKARVALSVLSGTISTAEICREHLLREQLIGRWKNELIEKAASIFENGDSNEEQERIAELERMVGRLTMEPRPSAVKKSLVLVEIEPQEKREIVMVLSNDYPVERVCGVLGISRSSYYYQPKAADETALKEALKTAAGEFVTYGNRRLTAQLQREGWEVGRKKVKRLMGELNIRLKIKKQKIKTTDSNHDRRTSKNLVKGLEIVRPEQVWVADITYIHLAFEVVYLAILMDVFTRIIRGWHLSRNIDQDLTLTALRKALSSGRIPTIHHSDQGRQYFADAYLDLLNKLSAQVSFADVGKLGQNAYAERVIRTIKEEEVYLNEYEDYQDVYRQVGKFIDDVYAQKRIHSSLGYLTPVEFEQQWINENQDGIFLTKKTDFCVQI